MRAVYCATDRPMFLDAQAWALLQEGRAAYAERALDQRQITVHGDDAYLFTWRGTRATETIRLALAMRYSHRNRCPRITRSELPGLFSCIGLGLVTLCGAKCAATVGEGRNIGSAEIRQSLARRLVARCICPIAPRHDRARCDPSSRLQRKLNLSFEAATCPARDQQSVSYMRLCCPLDVCRVCAAGACSAIVHAPASRLGTVAPLFVNHCDSNWLPVPGCDDPLLGLAVG